MTKTTSLLFILMVVCTGLIHGSKLFGYQATSTPGEDYMPDQYTVNTVMAAGKSYFSLSSINGLYSDFESDFNLFHKSQPLQKTQDYHEVHSISVLEEGEIGEYYRITGEVFLTFQDDFSLQKYIQDASGAILVEDAHGALEKGAFVEGDGITGISGKLMRTEEGLCFVPLEEGELNSTDNTIPKETITLSDLEKNPRLYSAKRVRIRNVRFETDGSSSKFSFQGDYFVTDDSGKIRVNLPYKGVPFLGNPVPRKELDEIEGIVMAEREPHINLLRIGNPVSHKKKYKGPDIKIYPNPATTEFHIEIPGGAAQVDIFSMLGRRVMAQRVEGKATIRIADLHSGVYLVKVTQNYHTSTKKLVVK